MKGRGDKAIGQEILRRKVTMDSEAVVQRMRVDAALDAAKTAAMSALASGDRKGRRLRVEVEVEMDKPYTRITTWMAAPI